MTHLTKFELRGEEDDFRTLAQVLNDTEHPVLVYFASEIEDQLDPEADRSMDFLHIAGAVEGYQRGDLPLPKPRKVLTDLVREQIDVLLDMCSDQVLGGDYEDARHTAEKIEHFRKLHAHLKNNGDLDEDLA